MLEIQVHTFGAVPRKSWTVQQQFKRTGAHVVSRIELAALSRHLG
jgi:hypothetical protein